VTPGPEGLPIYRCRGRNGVLQTALEAVGKYCI